MIVMTFSAGCSKGLVKSLKYTKAVDNAAEACEVAEVLSDSQHLAYDYMQTYELWGEEGACFDISVESTGGNIDILIMDVDNYINYDKGFEEGINKQFRAVTYKDVNSENFQYCLPESGTHYMVIENSKFLKGGADARCGVDISVSVK